MIENMVTLTMEASIEKRKYKQLIAHIFSKHISSVFVSVKIGSDATKADLELLILLPPPPTCRDYSHETL